MTGLHTATRGWESAAGAGPRLRGRRADGRGTTLHFIHGVGFCGGVYWTFLQKFLPHYSLFFHDLEGHGESDAPEQFSGIGALARRVPEVMRQQGLTGARPIVGIGHSFGAAMTLKVAADNPGLFRALVLLDPIVFPGPVWFTARLMARTGQHPMAKGARRRRFAWAGRQDAFDHLRGRGIYKGWPDDALACFVDHAMKPSGRDWVLRCPPELEAQFYEHPIWAWPSFRKVDVPVLFLHGARSYPFFPGAARKARRLNPKVQVATSPGHHCFMLEDPESAHRAVVEFLAQAHI